MYGRTTKTANKDWQIREGMTSAITTDQNYTYRECPYRFAKS